MFTIYWRKGQIVMVYWWESQHPLTLPNYPQIGNKHISSLWKASVNHSDYMSVS